jgi:DNA-binding CsgD family transcriptional regulator
VHRLVVLAFVGRIPRGKQVNHIDGDKLNNDIQNLEIVTPEQNREHAKRTGLIVRGEDNPSSRLTEKDVQEIRQLRADGVRVRDIANRFDISERTVYMACRRKTWRHVP